MTLTKRTEIGSRNITANGQIHVRVDTVIEEDGKEISRTYWRKVLAPGDILTNEAPEVVRVVREIMDLGVMVTLSTGRMFQSALPFARQLGITLPLICYQGALIKNPVSRESFFLA